MKLSEFKTVLRNMKTIVFQLPNGEFVPHHFHVTEVGKITKHFIDCGGTVRKEQVVNFQLWDANDYKHRLHPEKLLQIIEFSEKGLNIPDLNIEVEYQSLTIGKYGLDFNGQYFQLTNKQTDCLAKDNCGVPKIKQNVELSTLNETVCCIPEDNCC